MDILALQAGNKRGDGDDDGPRRAALDNPIILGAIFSHLDTKNVKQVRLVCKAWEAEGAIILGQRCRIPLHRLFIVNDYKFTAEPAAVNPKLLQSIVIHSREYVLKRQDGIMVPEDMATRCFSSFASIWHSDVQEIDVHMDIPIFDVLGTALNAYGFPNLTRIKIFKMPGIDSEEYLPLEAINTLKEIVIFGIDFVKACGYPLLQNLINSAPNLEVLNITGNFYPDLASCGRLKVLKWSGYQRKYFGPGLTLSDFEPEEVFRMLNQVGERLEHLRLALICFALGGCSLDKSFPTLPKLKSLDIDNYYKDFLRMVEQISPSLFPSLEKIAFCGQHILDGSRIDQSGFLTHDGVNSLKQLEVNRPDEIVLASQKFPNVNRLVIRTLDPKEEHVNKAEYISKMLQACSNWKLSYLELQIDKAIINRSTINNKGFRLSQLLEGLTSLSVFEGIKQVRIVVEKPLLDDDLDYDFQSFEDVLELSAEMDRMIFKANQGVKATTKGKVLKFLQQHKELPVFYLD